MFRSLPILSPLVHYFRVFHRYARGRLLFFIALAVLGSLLSGLGLTMMIPLLEYDSSDPVERSGLVRAIYDALDGIGAGVSLTSVLVTIFVVFLLKGALLFLQSMVRLRISTHMMRDMRLLLARAYRDMSYTYFTQTTSGYLTNALVTEINRALGCFQQYALLLAGIANVAIFLAYSALLNWRMPAVALAVGLLFIWPARHLARRVRKLSLGVSDQNAYIQHFMLQLVEGFKYLKATDRFSVLMDRLLGSVRRHRAMSLRGQVLAAMPKFLVEPIAVVIVSLCILYIVGVQGEALITNVVAVLLLDRSIRFIFQLHAANQNFTNLVGGLVMLEKVREEVARNREPDAGEALDTFRDAIRLEHVTFRYDQGAVLDDVSLVIKRQQTVGIVGESGAGKTTLFDVLTGLLVPQNGSVTLDGCDYARIRKADLRRLFGYVTQEPVLFNDTIRQNISLWTEGEGVEERIQQAARIAYCDEFIRQSESGYDTAIGDRGIRLSGGQRQRLAIAREIFRDPEILFFDEATSSLDSESEAYIQRSIREMHGQRTLVIIAHRVATVRTCDEIIVLERGRVVQQGSWDALIREEGSAFYGMCQLQGLV